MARSDFAAPLSLPAAPLASRKAPMLVLAVVCTFLLALVVRNSLPEPTSGLFFKAQRLEAAGQLDLALRQYAILTRGHKDSPYAPRALERQATLTAGMARQKGDAGLLKRALGLYLQIAQTYPSHPLAGDALSTAGNLALIDLHNAPQAKIIYGQLLERYPNNREYASEATLKMGRIALAMRDREGAQRWLQNVLQRYPTMIERCAEAQFHLGIDYETQWNDAAHKDAAKRAYQATVDRYPQSVWAASAKERLGLLYYGDVSKLHPERRVQIETAPLPEETAFDGGANGGLLAALRLLLAARGLSVGNEVLRGWSGAPFYAGFDPNNPARVVAAPFDAFKNIVATAGLNFSPTEGGTTAQALADLQRELDDARPPLIFDGHWRLAIGYDSSRGQVFLQSGGARYETVGVKELAQTWKQPSPLGGAFSMISFSAPGERPRLQSARAKALPPLRRDLENPAATPLPTPTATPSPSATTPTWIYQLAPLSQSAAHRRALKMAATWLLRPRDGQALLNGEALDALSRELNHLVRRPAPIAQATQPPPSGAADPTPAPQSTLEPSNDEIAAPAPAQTAATVQTPSPALPGAEEALAARNLTRARALTSWFGAPLSSWIAARRDAIAYLNAAANALNAPALRRARDELRASIIALQAARDALPASENLTGGSDRIELGDRARAALQNVARELDRAHQAERRALNAIGSV